MVIDRQRAALIAAGVSVLALAWTIYAWFGGGVDVSLLGIRLRSNDPNKTRLWAEIAFSIYVLCRGPARAREELSVLARTTLERLHRSSTSIALVLAVTLVGVGVRHGIFVAGGADSYGYLEEARLWRERRVIVDQPFMAEVPWSRARDSLAPLGFQPAPRGWQIVPVHAPGYPLVIAAVQSVAGYCSARWIVPISGGVIVLMTYLIGRLSGRRLVGLMAAAFVAVSPTTWFMLVQPMSDLPAAAAWAVSFVGILGNSQAAAWVAGLAAGLAILIRPNVVLLAGVFTLFALWLDFTRAPAWRLRSFRSLRFVAGVLAGISIEMLINAHLYGSPFRSGYGDLDFAVSHLGGNLYRYASWLAQTETPVIFLGIASLAIPAAAVWTTKTARRTRWFFLAAVVAVWLPVLLYTEFEAWWYLRYALATWPILAFATASCLAAVYRRGTPIVRFAAAAAFVVAITHNLDLAKRVGSDVAPGEQKYLDAARLVEEATGPDSMILTVQHSGSLRYYAGRMTMRWDQLDPGELDLAVRWLEQHGHRPFLLIEDGEVEGLQQKYGATDAAARLDWTPIAVLQVPSRVRLFDAAAQRHPPGRPAMVKSQPPEHCPEPIAPSGFSLAPKGP
jgi:hypothetical protein